MTNGPGGARGNGPFRSVSPWTGAPPVWNEGRSVHVGLDGTDDGVYRRTLPALRAAESDARAMRDLAARLGYSTRLLTGPDATCDAVLGSLGAAIERLAPGDALLVSFAGHGVELPEVRRFDLRPPGAPSASAEIAWCLRDGVLSWATLLELLAGVPEGTDVFLVADACSGASVGPGAVSLAAMLRSGALPRATLPTRVHPAGAASAGGAPLGPLQPGLRARVWTLSAAARGRPAFEGDRHGAFTAALLDAFSAGGSAASATPSGPRPVPSWAELMAALERRLPEQAPSLSLPGPPTPPRREALRGPALVRAGRHPS